MGVSRVDICNRALSLIGANNIASITENTREAKQCKIFYDPCREDVLREHNWNFAQKNVILGLLDETYAGWDYVYQYPSDCLKAIKVQDESGALSATSTFSGLSEQIKFEITASSDLNRKIILTDQENARLVYTANVTNENVFDPSFTSALVYRLAAELVIPMKGKLNLRQAMLATYQQMLLHTQGINANEGNRKEDEYNAFINART